MKLDESLDESKLERHGAGLFARGNVLIREGHFTTKEEMAAQQEELAKNLAFIKKELNLE